MERTFSEQEEALGEEEAAALEKHPRKPDAEKNTRNLDTAVETEGKIVTKGFSKLLTLWRRKLLQTLVVKAELEQELGLAIREIDRNRCV